MSRSVTSEQEWVAPVAAAVCSRGVQGPDVKADTISSTTLDIILALVATTAAAVSFWRSVLAGRQATEARKDAGADRGDLAVQRL
jgi:hypothetical protein